MIKRTKTLLSYASVMALILFIGAPSAFAIYGGQAGSIFSYGSDARSFAMGRTAATAVYDASAVYRNPACLMDVPKISGMFMSASLFDAYSYSVMAGVWPGLYEAYGVSMVALSSTAPFEGRSHGNVIGSAFTDTQSSMGGVYSKRINNQLSCGIGVKTYSRALGPSTDSSFIFDFGVNYRLFDNVMIGGMLNNVYVMNNSPLFTSDSIPMIWRGGITYAGPEYVFAFDVTDTFSQWYLGGEYRVIDMLLLRGGLNYEEMTFGLGVELNFARFDIALSNRETAGGTMKFSLIFNFGEDKKDAIDRETKRLIVLADNYNEKGFYNLARQTYTTIGIFDRFPEEVKNQVEKLDNVLKLSSIPINAEKITWERYSRARELMKAGNLQGALREAEEAEKTMPSNTELIDLVKFLKTTLEGS